MTERTVEGGTHSDGSGDGSGCYAMGAHRSGVLSGKYSRCNMKAESPGCAAMFEQSVNESVYNFLDVLAIVAKSRNTTSARIALAWLNALPAASSVIIGARTLDRLKNECARFFVLRRKKSACSARCQNPSSVFPSRSRSVLSGRLTAVLRSMAPASKRGEWGEEPPLRFLA